MSSDSRHLPNDTPHLEHVEAFKAALKSYHINPQAQAVLAAAPFVLVTGPTACGRNTIINQLVKTEVYHKVISDTTRPPRYNNGVREQNGEEYWFRSEPEFLDELRHGEFLEAELIHGQQVSGTSIRELKKAQKAQKIPINDVDIGGTRNVLNAKPDAIAIVVLPPSFEEWQRRIHGRGTVGKNELTRRLKTACTIFEAALSDPRLVLVVNDTVAHATAVIRRIAETEEKDPALQTQAQSVARELLATTKDYLDKE